MRKAAHLLGLFLFATASCFAMQGQTSLIVGYEKRVEIALSGATAAYALNANIADATAVNGMIQVFGKLPGSTNIVIVTQAGVQTLSVTVTAPPPMLPAGFDPPHAENGESGTYEFRYNSDPGQITNSLEMKRTQGPSFERFQMVNANLFSAGSSTSAIGFPYLSYEIGRPRRDYTFLDQTVANSPLTLDNYMVRGFHMREGDWQFHGGFTSIAIFQGLFLATDREYVVGGSRSYSINQSSSLQFNAYHFTNPESQQLIASNGTAGSLVYHFLRKDHINFLSELGISHGLGFAVRGTYDDEKTHLTGNFRSQSRSFASLAINNQHGTFADLNATRKMNNRLYASLDLNQSNFNLRTLQQNTFTSSGQLNFRINRNFSLNGGSAYSTFQSRLPFGQRIDSLNLPAGLDFSSPHFGSGFQYQRTINFDGAGGNDYAATLRGAFSNFQANVFYRHDVQVPTLAAVFSQIPGLQDALDRAGIVANTPDQLAQLLRNTSLLETLGFTNLLTVNLAPSRDDFGGSVNWTSHTSRREQVDLSYFNSDTQLLQGKSVLSTATLSYAQRINATNSIVGSAAIIHSSNGGVADTHPLFSISLQHRFYSVPSFILPGRHGVIEGHIFRDDELTGLYNGQPSLAGVEVKLDDERTTRTDENGYYAFHHVPYGVHRVEAVYQNEVRQSQDYQNDEPFFYTTDSPATTDINNTVNFGINFAKGQLFGYLLNDAGKGIGGITLVLRGEALTGEAAGGEAGQRTVTTAGNGKFSFPGLKPGAYSVTPLPETFPAGYALQALETQWAAVDSGKPASVQFTVKALRSISGKVTVYDKNLMRTVPLPGAIVRLKELSLQTVAAENGAYIFRNLPAGSCTISVEYQGKETTQKVIVPSDPDTIRDVELSVGSK
jgi:hypothetical protein